MRIEQWRTGWTSYAGDLVVVVVGILIALGIDGAVEQRRDRRISLSFLPMTWVMAIWNYDKNPFQTPFIEPTFL